MSPKKRIVLFILIVIFFSSSYAQKTPLKDKEKINTVTFYRTTGDYIHKRPMKQKALAIIKRESSQHIRVKKFINPITRKKIKHALSAWAIEYNGENYFNLGYSDDLNNWKTYAKFDIEGRYCAIIIDKNSPNILKSNSNFYGGGLTGVLIGESSKWGKNWIDKSGNKKKILFIDTMKINPQRMGRNSSSSGNYLTRKQLNDIIQRNKIDLKEKEIKDLSFEEVIEIIKKLNNKRY